MDKEIITITKEDGKTVITMSEELRYSIWSLVQDWPDIISNDENLKVIMDLNMTKEERIEEITEAFYQIFNTIGTDCETVIRIVDTDK